MKETWKAIENKLKEIAPLVYEDLNGGATQEQIEELERVIGAKLPGDFVIAPLSSVWPRDSSLLLLHFLLHDDLVFEVHKRLENVGIEQRGADVVELHLEPIDVLVNAGCEHFVA